MHQGKRSSSLCLYSVDIVMLVLVISLILSGSCFFDTKTTFCERSGLRCKPSQVCAAEQGICVDIGGCGDSAISGDEVCDDGNTIDGDGCSANCKSNEICGNGIRDAIKGESCDNGDRNGTFGDNCSDDCVLTDCGNRIVDVNEECDPGKEDSPGCNSNLASPRYNCKFAKCGDGYKNSAAGEDCDNGEFPSATCNSPIFCKTSICGDSYFNLMAGEECDTGGDSKACNGNGNGAGGAGNCQVPKCGDSYINKKYKPLGATTFEECDTGGVDTQECNGSAMAGSVMCANPKCGDGYKNQNYKPVGADSVEQCDASGENTAQCNGNNGGIEGKGSCRTPKCGDGYLNPKFAPTAADGVPTTANPGEMCDGGGNTSTCNGNDGDADGMPDDGVGSCQPASCGDGYINPAGAEACDKGGASGNPPPRGCSTSQFCKPDCSGCSPP